MQVDSNKIAIGETSQRGEVVLSFEIAGMQPVVEQLARRQLRVGDTQ